MSKSVVIFWTILILVAITTAYFLYAVVQTVKPPTTTTLSTSTISVQGTVQSVNPVSNELVITTSKAETMTIQIGTTTDIRDVSGIPIDITAIATGTEISLIGQRHSSSVLVAHSIIIPTNNESNNPVQPSNVFRNSLIPSSYEITGMADATWLRTSGYFSVHVLDGNGTIIDLAKAYPQGPIHATDTLASFVSWLSFDPSSTATGTIQFRKVIPQGSTSTPEVFSIPIRFADQAGGTSIRLYYPNTRKAHEVGNVCSADTLLPVERRIADSQTPIQDAITLLLKGDLTPDEKTDGFTTQVPNSGFKLVSEDLKNTTLTLQFTDVQAFAAGDPCYMQLLSEEIIKTAQQFENVKTVVILPETIFQP